MQNLAGLLRSINGGTQDPMTATESTWEQLRWLLTGQNPSYNGYSDATGHRTEPAWDPVKNSELYQNLANDVGSVWDKVKLATGMQQEPPIKFLSAYSSAPRQAVSPPPNPRQWMPPQAGQVSFTPNYLDPEDHLDTIRELLAGRRDTGWGNQQPQQTYDPTPQGVYLR